MKSIGSTHTVDMGKTVVSKRCGRQLSARKLCANMRRKPICPSSVSSTGCWWSRTYHLGNVSYRSSAVTSCPPRGIGCPAVKNKRSKRAQQVLLFSFSLAEYRRKHDQQQHRQRSRPARSTTRLSSFLFLLCFGVFTSHNHRNDRSGWLVPHPGGPEITQQSTDETRPSMARTARRSAIACKHRQCPALPCVYLVRVNSHPAMVAQRNSRYVWLGLPSW